MKFALEIIVAWFAFSIFVALFLCAFRNSIDPNYLLTESDDDAFTGEEFQFRAGHPHGADKTPGSGLPSHTSAAGSQTNPVRWRIT